MRFHLIRNEKALQMGHVLLDGRQILQTFVVEVLDSDAKGIESGLI